MSAVPPRRRGRASFWLASDVLRWSWHTRNWLLLVLILTVAISLVVGATVQYVAPWTIYTGL